ncbi:MAG: PaaI family thioesterase [Eubacteriaceae bacterium]
MTLSQYQSFFRNDQFATKMGAVIQEIEEDYVRCSFEINKDHLNAGGIVQGGAIFTLGDFAFAVAANRGENLVVSIDSSINFLRATQGKVLYAEARIISQTKRTCLCEIIIKDDLETLIAKMSVTGFITDKKINA